MQISGNEIVKILTRLNVVLLDVRKKAHFFSLFDMLGIHTKELIHSRFIAGMLDPNGSHGQGRKYLNIFLRMLNSHLSSSRHISELNESDRVSVVVEEYAGSVDVNNIAGGRIDIVIRYGDRTIFIENKIYAADQPTQLIRYNKYNPEALILYLTLYGTPASEESAGKAMIPGANYFCISYNHDIKDWINQCTTCSNDLPELQMAFKTYAKCVNTITWSDEMSQQILKQIIAPDTISTVMHILSMKDNIIQSLRMRAVDQLDEIAKELCLQVECDRDSVFIKSNIPYRMTCQDWGDVAIGMAATSCVKDDIKGVYFCIHSSKKNSNLRSKINKVLNSEWPIDKNEDPNEWPYYKYLEGSYRDWGVVSPIWNDIVNGSFKSMAKRELESLKIILNKALAFKY